MIRKIVRRYELYGERGIVLNKRIAEHIKIELICAVFFSLFIGIIGFGILFFTGQGVLSKTVYGQAFTEQMENQQFSKLQDYVKKESISLENLQRINAWCSRGEKVYLTIYNNGTLVFESNNLDIDYDESELLEYNPDYEDPEREYELILQGDIKVRAFLYYYVGDAYYFLVTIISGLCAFCLFTFCFMTIINRKITYIRLLKKELDILSSGQLEYPITISGKDELSELAHGIDQMRRSIIKHQEVEQQIKKANTELITSMSHDLRTPLTSLLAFLEIIERKKYKDEEQMNDLLHKSLDQTMRIKHMADQLFGYFWQHSTDWEYTEMEEIDADQFLNFIMSDYVYAFESKGMKVKTEFSPVLSNITINLELFQRAMDNIYSNIVKYADPEEIISISYKKKDSYVQIAISNVICKNKISNESTGMGLNICCKIVELHKGNFSANESDGKFYMIIDIPLKE